MISVIDYGTGNLRSVENALASLDCEFIVTADPRKITEASHVVLPGVGEASSAMAKLVGSGLAELIPNLTQPVIGICIGMQLMCLSSEEGDVKCLGIFDTQVKRLTSSKDHKVPHMGWNTVNPTFQSNPLFSDLTSDSYFYYVHSYAADIHPEQTIAVTNHNVDFSAVLCKRNFFGTQFHPEKSGDTGRQLLANFLKL